MITIISFPRSGQHLIERFLKFYTNHKNLPYSYCGFYKYGVECRCVTHPCKENRIFQKQHDLNLDLPINPLLKYVILYRYDIIAQLEAYHRYTLGKRGKSYPDENIVYDDSTIKDLSAFIRDKSMYYINFRIKWTLNQYNNMCQLPYELLLSEPKKSLQKLIQFLYDTVDNTAIDLFLAQEPIKQQHTIAYRIGNVNDL